eukprot:364657-Chlamydomonas_euryale.AAC.3
MLEAAKKQRKRPKLDEKGWLMRMQVWVGCRNDSRKSEVCWSTTKVKSEVCWSTTRVKSEVCWGTTRVKSEVCWSTTKVKSEVCWSTTKVKSEVTAVAPLTNATAPSSHSRHFGAIDAALAYTHSCLFAGGRTPPAGGRKWSTTLTWRDFQLDPKKPELCVCAMAV